MRQPSQRYDHRLEATSNHCLLLTCCEYKAQAEAEMLAVHRYKSERQCSLHSASSGFYSFCTEAHLNIMLCGFPG